MTAAEILNVVTTVAVTQLVVDLLCRYMVFSRDSYKRAVASLERAQARRDKLAASLDAENAATSSTAQQQQQANKQDKQAKKLQRLQDDCSDAASEVARRHSVPGFCASIVFLILCRILGTEHSSRVIAVLPFTPFRLMRKLTLRGLDLPATSPSAADVDAEKVYYTACSFLFIYVLSALSVKYFVHLLVGVSPPREADGGLSTVMEGPKNQKMLKSLGIDTDYLKSS